MLVNAKALLISGAYGSGHQLVRFLFGRILVARLSLLPIPLLSPFRHRVSLSVLA